MKNDEMSDKFCIPRKTGLAQFSEGKIVHVNRDDDQWGRIAYDGEVIGLVGNRVLVAVENIRANVLCEEDELTLREM